MTETAAFKPTWSTVDSMLTDGADPRDVLDVAHTLGAPSRGESYVADRLSLAAGEPRENISLGDMRRAVRLASADMQVTLRALRSAGAR